MTTNTYFSSDDVPNEDFDDRKFNNPQTWDKNLPSKTRFHLVVNAVSSLTHHAVTGVHCVIQCKKNSLTRIAPTDTKHNAKWPPFQTIFKQHFIDTFNLSEHMLWHHVC